MKNEKPWCKKWLVCLLSVVFLAIIIAIPFIINETYKYGLKSENPYITMWGAEDVLNFYGTLLGATATIVALIITIRFTAYQSLKDQQEQRALLIKEYQKEQLLKDNAEKIKQLEMLRTLFLLETIEEKPQNLWTLFNYKELKFQRFISEFSDYRHTLDIINEIKNTNTRTFVKEFTLFVDNTMLEIEKIQRKTEHLREEKKEYLRALEEFQARKNEFEKTNNHKFSLNSLDKDYVPPYGIFELEEPQDESELIDELFESLVSYRDKNKDKFIESFDGMLQDNKEILKDEITTLYNKEEE